MIRFNGKNWPLYSVVNPETNRIQHARLFSTHANPIDREFLAEFCEKHDVSDAVFLVDGAAGFASSLRQEGLKCRFEIHGYRSQVERAFQAVQGLAPLFSDCFSNTDPQTVETWLQAHAVW